MKIEINGQTYRVKWLYDADRIETLCTIVDETDEIVFSGMAVRKHGDVHNKEIARKQSLKSALKQADNKDVRTQFWESYFNRKHVAAKVN
jgi:hypothetical protein